MERALCILLGLLTLTALPLYAQVDLEHNIEAQHLELARQPARKTAYIHVDEDSLLKMLDSEPSFGLYKDNYVVTGFPLDRRITRTTADVKIQISFRQRLTQSVLPLKTFLLLTYTQRIYWYLYQASAPFADINLNPGLTLAKNVIVDNKLYGLATFGIEHESNGKGDSLSRAWNYFAFSYTHYFNARFSGQARLNIPFGLDKKYTPRFPRYRGVLMLAFNYLSANQRLHASAVVNLRKTIGCGNVTLEMSYKLNPRSNQFAFVQFYSGYAEDMMEFKQYRNMFRIGFVVKPRFENIH